ncbi:MAG: hypothetical protein LBQ20_02610 [Rhodanobacter sp.]|jgi:hypothetical protein|nr:hypothetical protein [Rhodanobacter sp.]
MKKTFLVFFVSLFLCITGTSAAGITKRNKITTHQAKALALAALTPEQSRLPGVEALSGKDFGADSDEDSDDPRFMIITVVWATTTDGSVNVGLYEIDIYTGDVFNGAITCYEYENKKLVSLQKQVRRSLYLTPTAYKKIKTTGPLCEH